MIILKITKIKILGNTKEIFKNSGGTDKIFKILCGKVKFL
jgi:hypothetical protein